MGFAGGVSALLLFLVAGAVASDQIFTASGERRWAALNLTGALLNPHPVKSLAVLPLLNPSNPPFRRCVCYVSLTNDEFQFSSHQAIRF
jgi:hypothetical protein